ncbi:dnaJ homolog subfamily C member P58IPK [Lycorma delicatula]|uniref:dnaJ homolog subfamily C member P58IPK n=1 Tax=Lycorma delicatula TaxID=130591 RepID=UPI003F50E845
MEYFQAFNWRLYSYWIFLVSFDVALRGSDGSVSKAEIEKHLQMGRDMLARGQLQDALSHYHAAVEGDSENYLTYFKRGTVYLALGKARFAILDFNKVLELKPDFAAARLQRAHVLMKQAQLDEAKEDYMHVYNVEGNEEAITNYYKADELKSEIESVDSLMSVKDYQGAIDALTKVIESCPWSSRHRELRSVCHVALGDTMSAILDLRSTTKLQPDNTAGYFKLAILHYQLGQPQESLREIRECLKLDPDHPECFPHYKKVKKIDKFLSDCQTAVDNKNYKDCIESALKMLKLEPDVKMIVYAAKEKLCHCYLHDDQISTSLLYCTEALAIHKDQNVLCDRAEAYINSEMYDEAVRDYHDALDINDNYQRAKEGMQRAQKLLKISEKRDYYKILEVKRTASKREIIKAYRKAAQKWHPDNFPENEEKKRAEKKFIDIAAAKEVLTDEEKRKRFDEGEDPLDPESPANHQEGFNPFQQFHQFHGSPFQFKFHFN